MRLAYLVNQHPQPSLTFVRREIEAHEAAGVPVARFTVRRFGGALVDERDRVEERKTRAILERGAVGIAWDTLAVALGNPAGFLRALATTWRHGRANGRGRLVQLAYLAEAAALLRTVRAEEIQHIHAHFGTNSTEVALLCRLLGGPPYSFTVHGPEEFDAPHALHLGEKVAHAKLAVAISSYGRSQLWRWSSYADWPKVRVVHCGLDTDFLSESMTPVPEVAELICVGRLSEQKGHLLLVEAAGMLAERGMEFVVRLLGEGPLRGEIERVIEEKGLKGRIVLEGAVSTDRVREAIIHSRGMVLPSFAEGLPVVLMEALALGRPVVATAVAGVPELVRPASGEGGNGWLVPAGDADALAEAMGELLATPVERLSELGRRGGEAVRRRHDVAVEAARLRQLLGMRNPSPAPDERAPVKEGRYRSEPERPPDHQVPGTRRRQTEGAV